MTIPRPERLEALAKFMEDLGAYHRRTFTCGADEFRTYDWAATDSHKGKWDRILLVHIFLDGSWQVYLDTASLKLEDTAAELHRMVTV